MVFRKADDGSIAIAMIVVLVATSLVIAVGVLADSGLRTSRRSGDSANALQLADAGVNDAVKQLTNYTGPLSNTRPAGYNGPLPIMPPISRSLGASGDRYDVIAAKLQPSNPFSPWHITALGTDATGTKRKIEADSVSDTLFSDAIFGKANLTMGSGIAVDSYTNGLTPAATCTGRGSAGTENPSQVDVRIGSGNGVRNCTGQNGYPTPRPNSGDGWVWDRCTAYAETPPVPSFQHESQNDSCGEIKKVTPKVPIDDVTIPSGSLSDFTCDASTAAMPPGTYYFKDVTLANGCNPVPQSFACLATVANPGIPFTSSCLTSTTAASPYNPVKIVVKGSLTIGETNGSVVNRPPSGCPDTTAGSDYYGGVTQSPLAVYCAGWPGSLQIYAGGSSDVTLKKVDFWGTVYAPQRRLIGGSPQTRIWGALLAGTVDTHAQLVLHYDESLAGLATGRYSAVNWHEVGIAS